MLQGRAAAHAFLCNAMSDRSSATTRLYIEKFAYQLIEYEHKTIEFLPNSLFSGNNANPNPLSESEAKNLRYSRHCAFVELLQKLLLSVIYFFAHYKREEGTGVGRTLSFKMHRLLSAQLMFPQ